MSSYWLHPDGRDGARRLRPRNGGPFPGGLVDGSARNGHRTAEEGIAPPAGSGASPRPDQVLALRVAEALVRDRAVRGRRVEVTVRGTVVILRGEIESPDASIAAEICVRSTPGVSEVANRLVVG